MTPTTLSQAWLPRGGTMRDLALILAGSLLIAVAAKVSVPLWPAPMSLQTLAVLLIGFLYGARLGTATVLVYLAEGAMGLPVFTPTTAPGLMAFAGPTAGFLVGFVPMAWLAGTAAERGLARGFLGTAAAAIAISAALYLIGAAWPLAVAGALGIEAGWAALTPAQVAGAFVVPFLLGDLVKSLIAAVIVSGGWAIWRH